MTKIHFYKNRLNYINIPGNSCTCKRDIFANGKPIKVKFTIVELAVKNPYNIYTDYMANYH